MQRDFKGVWVPKEIWLDDNLTWMEKLLITEINSLDDEIKGCWASNNYLAEFFKLSSGRISQIIKELIDKKYVSAEYIRDGKTITKRVLRILNRGIKNTKQGIKDSKEGYLENDKESNTLCINTMSNIKKEQHLDFVFLKKEELEKLLNLYDKKIVDRYILKLDTYLTNNPKKQAGKKTGYKSHYKTLLNWMSDEPKIKETELDCTDNSGW